MTILVTGGAGYIGGHVVAALAARGDAVVVIDDLSSGDAARLAGAPIYQLDVADDANVETMTAALRDHQVDAVIHLAARKQVAESVARPSWYYRQNVGGLANVLSASVATGVSRFVLSSSAAVYRSSPRPVREDDPATPSNPYGETKLAGEWLLAAQAQASQFRGISLRYFNVAGAARAELADREANNLVPMVFERIEAGRPPLIFGDDYDTPDGTCIRDYIHVQDLAEAHLAALDRLSTASEPHRVYNVGTGTGDSVRDMVDRMLRIAGSSLDAQVEPRRAGDPAVVVADASRIRDELGWTPRLGIEDILESAWAARG